MVLFCAPKCALESGCLGVENAERVSSGGAHRPLISGVCPVLPSAAASRMPPRSLNRARYTQWDVTCKKKAPNDRRTIFRRNYSWLTCPSAEARNYLVPNKACLVLIGFLLYCSV